MTRPRRIRRVPFGFSIPTCYYTSNHFQCYIMKQKSKSIPFFFFKCLLFYYHWFLHIGGYQILFTKDHPNSRECREREKKMRLRRGRMARKRFLAFLKVILYTKDHWGLLLLECFSPTLIFFFFALDVPCCTDSMSLVGSGERGGGSSRS